MVRLMLVAALLWAGVVQAAQTNLQARDLDLNLPGHEAVFDQARGVTWLRDVTVSGLQSWDEQMVWAQGLEIGPYSGWRLSTSNELDGIYWTLFPLHYPGGRLDFASITVVQHLRGGFYWTSEGNQLLATGRCFCDIPDEGFFSHEELLYAWAVHPGDIGVAVSPVPEPSAWALMLAGAALLMVRRHAATSAPMSGSSIGRAVP